MIKGKLLKELILPFVIGLICAVVSAVLLFRYVQEVEANHQVQQIQQASAHKPVIVSTVPLGAGMLIQAEHLRARDLDETSLPSDAIHPSDANQLIGQRVRADIPVAIDVGKPIQWVHLQPQDTASFASTLAPGMVPFSMPINSLQQHSGLLKAGDVIDLYAGKLGNAELMLERVEIIATGGVTKAQEALRAQLTSARFSGAEPPVSGSTARNDYQQITLAIPLQQYLLLRQLADRKALWPILRNENDSIQLSHLQGAQEIEIILPGQARIGGAQSL